MSRRFACNLESIDIQDAASREESTIFDSPVDGHDSPAQKQSHHFSPKHLIEKLSRKESEDVYEEHRSISRVFSFSRKSHRTESGQLSDMSREASSGHEEPSLSPKTSFRQASPKARILRALSGKEEPAGALAADEAPSISSKGSFRFLSSKGQHQKSDNGDDLSRTSSASTSPSAAPRPTATSPKGRHIKALSGKEIEAEKERLSPGPSPPASSPSHTSTSPQSSSPLRRTASGTGSPKRANEELYASLFDPAKHTYWGVLQRYKALRFHSCYIGLTKQYCALFDDNKQFVGIYDLTHSSIAINKPTEFSVHGGKMVDTLMFRFDSETEARQWREHFTATINFVRTNHSA